MLIRNPKKFVDTLFKYHKINFAVAFSGCYYLINRFCPFNLYRHERIKYDLFVMPFRKYEDARVLVRKTLEELETLNEKQEFKVFDGLEPRYYGVSSLLTRFHCLIPNYYSYSKLDDINIEYIRESLIQAYDIIVRKTFFDTKEGKKFLESFVLTENAKRFIIRSHHYMDRDLPIILKALIVGIMTHAYLMITHLMLKGLKVPLFHFANFCVVLVNAIFFLFFSGFMFAFVDSHYKMQSYAYACTEGKIDSFELSRATKNLQPVKLDKDLLKGGIEYLEKLDTRYEILGKLIAENDCTRTDFWSVYFTSDGIKFEFIKPYLLKDVASKQLKSWLDSAV